MDKMKYLLSTLTLLLMCFFVNAQPGISELNNTTSEMKGWWEGFSNLSLVIAGIFGLLGGARVYRDWNLGLREITWPVARWFFACFFMVMIRVVVKALLI